MARAKKTFDAINTEPMYSTIAAATAEVEQTQEELTARKTRKTYTAEELQEFKANLKTTGHKGAKMQRMNIAFAPDIYDYVQTMSRVRGETFTEFVNLILKRSMDEYADVYARAIEFKNSL